MACAGVADPGVTDHDEEDRRDENLTARFMGSPPAVAARRVVRQPTPAGSAVAQ
jgi:hypothetical protein